SALRRDARVASGVPVGYPEGWPSAPSRQACSSRAGAMSPGAVAAAGVDRPRRQSLMTEVTRILSDIEPGAPQAAEQLLALVYDELRKLAAQRLAQERPGQTLQATALVHEAYLRLVGDQPDRPWDGRRHFFAAAAEAMRRILIDRARDR